MHDIFGIYEVKQASVELYQLVAGRYEIMLPNERGHYPIYPLGVELGIWQGYYLNAALPWLRWWDEQGNLLLTGDERAEQAEQENARLREKLRALGVDPDAL
ncbi:hypothetical protein NIES2109_03870 [Nostoc sp. HK-01]|uniref:Uncharacterized protein n=2 Tax=Nostocales TaxID=1161 RepID=A0A1Z4GJW4_9CYAN|nr:hypothetical protein NIES21_36420 [Anabaenopsis circularis NIES-21]BBD57620.1 hypothetical protein NIES2109_03870 [Nostoc sp. HK-01]GBE91356.1 transcriptional regulator [Nostoc cycadae WK-1]